MKRTIVLGSVAMFWIASWNFAVAAESPGLPPAAILKPKWTNWWANRWTSRRGRMRGAPIWRSRRNRRRISSPGASSGWIKCIGRLSTHCLEQELKSKYYEMPDLLKPLLPPPKGRLLAGLLWTGRLADYRVELHWPADVREIPSPEAVEVRVYPTPYGWFGWTVDKILSKPEVSADRRTWTYNSGSATEIGGIVSEEGKLRTEAVPLRKWSRSSTKKERRRAASSLPCRVSG